MRYHQLVEESVSKAKVPPSKRIFVVHGKDEENRELLKRILIEWGLDPIILDEKPIRGKTLIERLIEYTSQVGFAFIIMTPDDIGMEKSSIGRFVDGVTEHWHEPSASVTAVTTGSNTVRSYPTGLKQAIEKAIPQYFELRARQNILFEYGLCVGLLGREKVCLLLKGNVVFPADIRGIVYISFKEKVSETDCRSKIRQELEESGYELRDQRIIWNGPAAVSLDELHELAEVPDQQLPPELVAEKARLSQNRNVVSKVRIFRRTDGTFVIKWDEM
jgi:predicted nucleotide-binding protein